MVENIIIGIIIMAIGVGSVIFRRPFIQYIVSFQNKAFGFHFGQRTIDLHAWFAIPFGILLTIIGLLSLIGVIEWG